MTETLTIAVDDPLAQQHSDQLKQLIVAAIEQAGGWISFADFMQLCLYHPGLGYYSAGSHKLGQGGDFTTAPEMSCLFGYSLASHIHDVALQLADFDILEFGAGSGQMAIDVLQQLSRLGKLPEHYFILETSADLRERQQQRIKAALPTLIDRVQWLSAIPDLFCGVILANEVCDAMPVHLLKLTEGKMKEQGVSKSDNGFEWQCRPITDERLLLKAEGIRGQIGAGDYLTEVSLLSSDWLQTIADRLRKGAVFILDYGYPFNEYYRPERTQGTLRCYFQHQAHDNPLVLPGLQDITAHVDFTSLADIALDAGLEVVGFHEQADFLIAGDITQHAAELQQHSEPLDWLRHSSALKQLLLPGAMGHQFKVLSLTRGLALLSRLQIQDRRYQL